MEAVGAAASVAGLISLALEVPKLIDALIRIRSTPEEAREMSKIAGAWTTGKATGRQPSTGRR